MIDRVEKEARVSEAQQPGRSWMGETEPCINGRILGIGSYFKEPNDALAKQASYERATRRRRLELRSTTKQPLFVPLDHMRARRTARL